MLTLTEKMMFYFNYYCLYMWNYFDFLHDEPSVPKAMYYGDLNAIKQIIENESIMTHELLLFDMITAKHHDDPIRCLICMEYLLQNIIDNNGCVDIMYVYELYIKYSCNFFINDRINICNILLSNLNHRVVYDDSIEIHYCFGDVMILNIFLEKFKSLMCNTKDVICNTILHIASIHNDIKFVKSILKYKDDFNINSKNVNGMSALYCASLVNNTDVVKLLLENGCDPE